MILLLAVSMDYSIFLLHRYQEEKNKGDSKEDAMARAIHATWLSITSSSITTIAGFLALLVMQLTLGRDIGIVMANSLLGEITPAIATAIGDSHAFKILIPVNRCNHYVVGCQEAGLGEYIRLVCEKVDSMLS